MIWCYLLNRLIHYMKKFITCNWLFILIIAVSSCRNKSVEEGLNEARELQLVEQSINNVFGWALNKDFNKFYGSIANDSDFISVTPYGRVKFGFNEVRKDSSFWESPDFRAIRHELRDLHIQFSQNKDVAWFFCYLDDINEWKGEPASWENARWTGVLEKRNGKWVVVQQHFSFAYE